VSFRRERDHDDLVRLDRDDRFDRDDHHR